MTLMVPVTSAGQNVLESALALREIGFAIHWLKSRSKKPAYGIGWPEAPVASVSDLRRTWSDGLNVGVRLGEFSRLPSGEYLHLLDIDIREPAKASEAWAALAGKFPSIDFSQFPCVISGSGGESRHIYLATDRPFSSGMLKKSDGYKMVYDREKSRDVKKHDWEIELFGTGRQAVVPPSIHPASGMAYRWERPFDYLLVSMGITSSLPSSVVDIALARPDTGVEYADETSGARLGLSLDEAEAILSWLPLDEWCEDREGWRTVGMALKHEFGEDGFPLWTTFSKQSAKFDARNQRTVWKSFKGRTAKPVRMATLERAAKTARQLDNMEEEPEVSPEESAIDPLAAMLGDATSSPDDPFGDADGSPTPPRVPGWVSQLNEKHAVAFVEGKTIVLSTNDKGAMSYGSVADLHHFYENQRRPTERGSSRPITKAWMEHPKRRSYPNGIVFAPAGGPPGAYNTWTGFSVEPDPDATCQRFLDHLLANICGGCEEIYGWVIRWFAHMIQRPEEKPGTALVLRGAKGSGKDTVGDYVGSLFEPHHVKIATSEHLVGRFNAHHERTLLLHVEEGFWAGNKQAEGALKHLITSPEVMIEPKGINAFKVDSVLRIFITSNEDWVVPATFDERRFAVLNVHGGAARDTTYFGALRAEMNHGGRAALLHHLQSLCLDGFDVRNPPVTEGLRDQKIQSLRNIDKWWLEVLSAGDTPSWAMALTFDDDVEGDPWDKQISVQRSAIRTSYREWMRDQRFEGAVLNETEFGRRLKVLIPALETARPRLADGTRSREYQLPPRDICRESFCTVLGLPVSWDGYD